MTLARRVATYTEPFALYDAALNAADESDGQSQHLQECSEKFVIIEKREEGGGGSGQEETTL